jgi:hypothetical protein
LSACSSLFRIWCIRMPSGQRDGGGAAGEVLRGVGRPHQLLPVVPAHPGGAPAGLPSTFLSALLCFPAYSRPLHNSVKSVRHRCACRWLLCCIWAQRCLHWPLHPQQPCSDCLRVRHPQMGVIPSDDPEQSERFCQLRIMYRWGAALPRCTPAQSAQAWQMCAQPALGTKALRQPTVL